MHEKRTASMQFCDTAPYGPKNVVTWNGCLFYVLPWFFQGGQQSEWHCEYDSLCFWGSKAQPLSVHHFCCWKS